MLAGPELSAGGGVLLDADGCCGAIEAALLASLAVLLSTIAPKMSLPDAWSYRADRCAAPWKDTFAAASELTLNTGRGLSQWTCLQISKDRAIPAHKKYQYISMAYAYGREPMAVPRRSLFCPAARFAVGGV